MAGAQGLGQSIQHVVFAGAQMLHGWVYQSSLQPVQANALALQLANANPGAKIWVVGPVGSGGYFTVAGHQRVPGPYMVVADPSLSISGSGGSGLGGGGTGGMGGTGSGPAGAQVAGAAVQAGMPSYTGGGARVAQQAVNNSIVMQQRDDSFLGLDTFTPKEKLGAGYSPDTNNWDGFTKIGSRCLRRGTAKFEDDHASMGLNSALKGLSLSFIPNDSSDQLQMMATFADAAIGATRAAQATVLKVVQTAPLWGQIRTLAGVKGPQLTLTDQTGQILRVNYDYTNVFNSAHAGVMKNNVQQVIVRYALTGYPRDVDGNDYVNSVVLRNRVSWDGTATNIDTGALTAAQYFVTAWGVSIAGYSEPTYATKTLA